MCESIINALPYPYLRLRHDEKSSARVAVLGAGGFRWRASVALAGSGLRVPGPGLPVVFARLFARRQSCRACEWLGFVLFGGLCTPRSRAPCCVLHELRVRTRAVVRTPVVEITARGPHTHARRR